jgi:hypothetical protein
MVANRESRIQFQSQNLWDSHYYLFIETLKFQMIEYLIYLLTAERL